MNFDLNLNIKNFNFKLLTSTLIIFLFLNKNSLISFGTSFLDVPVWNENGTTEVSASLDKDTFLNIESESAILIEENTGEILYEKNSHQKLHPASITKIMTILLVMENLKENNISLTDKVPCSENASSMGGSQIWLSTNETLTVEEMLKAICVVSANDCAVAMAEYISGSEEAFVILMNEKAKKLGMNDTTFKNCHGIDEEGHLSSSYDISIMSRELLKNYPEIKKYTSIWMDSLRDGSSQLVNTNKLIRTYEGATGLKTGSTSLALYNLSASATRDNFSLISVVLKAPTTELRFKEAKLLLDYGFNKYTYKNLAEKNSICETVDVYKGTENKTDLVFETSSGAIIEKNNTKNIEKIVNIKENITAPISKNEVLGNIEYLIDGKTISKVNLVSSKDIPKKTFTNFFKEINNKYFRLLN